MKQIAVLGFNDYCKEILVELIQKEFIIQGVYSKQRSGSCIDKSPKGLEVEQVLNLCTRGIQPEIGYSENYFLEFLGQCYHSPLYILNLDNQDLENLKTISAWNTILVLPNPKKFTKEYIDTVQELFKDRLVLFKNPTPKKMTYLLNDLNYTFQSEPEVMMGREKFQKHIHGPGCSHVVEEHQHGPGCSHDLDHHNHSHSHHPGCNHDHNHSHATAHHQHGPNCNHSHDHQHNKGHKDHQHGPNCKHISEFTPSRAQILLGGYMPPLNTQVLTAIKQELEHPSQQDDFSDLEDPSHPFTQPVSTISKSKPVPLMVALSLSIEGNRSLSLECINYLLYTLYSTDTRYNQLLLEQVKACFSLLLTKKNKSLEPEWMECIQGTLNDVLRGGALTQN